MAKFVTVLGCMFFLVGTAIWVAEDPSGVLESGFCSSPTTIDGRITPGEWTEAKIVSLEMEFYDSGLNIVETHPVKIYLMNNREDLFVGLTLEQEEHDGTWSEDLGKAAIDVFMILFDNNDDGAFGSGEDKKFLGLVEGMSIYSDQHDLSEEEEEQGEEEEDKLQHGGGAISHSNIRGVGDYTAEFRIPLSTGDAYDINVKPGGKIRWNIMVFDKFGSELTEMSLGALSSLDLEESSDWGYLALASTPSGLEISSEQVPSGRNSQQEKAEIRTESDPAVIPKGNRLLRIDISPSEESDYAYIGQFIIAEPDVEDFIEKTGSTPPIVFFFFNWVLDDTYFKDPNNPAPLNPIDKETIAFFNRLSDRGSVPAIAWEMPVRLLDIKWDEIHLVPNIPRILNGEFDDYITDTARTLKEYGKPIMMTLLGEFNNFGEQSFGSNGFGAPGWDGDPELKGDVDDLVGNYGDPRWPDGPERVRDAFIHVIDLFRQEGADNVTWFMYGGTNWLVENMTEDQGDAEWWSHPKYYYPGDEYIDWVGKSVHFTTFVEFKNRFEPAYDAWGEVTQRPFCIPEFNFDETAKSRSKLMRQVFLDYFPTKPRFKAAMLLHSPIGDQLGFDWVVPLGGKKGKFPDEIQTWKEVVVKNPYYRSEIPNGNMASLTASRGDTPWNLPLLAPGNHLTIQRCEEFKFSPVVEAELNAKWDTAVARGMDIAMVGVDWVAVEPAPGVYDKAKLEEPLKACQAKGLQPVLLLTTIDSNGYYAMPAEFVDPTDYEKLANGMRIDDPKIIARYKALLDWVVPMLLKYNGFILSIANEPECIFGGKPEEQQQFVNFLVAIREHTRTITKDLAVTATLTRAVLTGDLDNVIAECDVAYFNYYGQRDFGQDDALRPEPTSMVSHRIDELLAVAKGRQLILQETGMSAGYEDKPSTINCTPQIQSEFLENLFAKLKAEPRFRGACVFLMPDMSKEWCVGMEQLHINEGLPKSLTDRILESYATLGLCRNTDGSGKPAWNTFLTGLDTIYGSKKQN